MQLPFPGILFCRYNVLPSVAYIPKSTEFSVKTFRIFITFICKKWEDISIS